MRDVNAYFQKFTLPETGKTVYKFARSLADAQVLQFINYVEEWETDLIGLENDNKCRSSLLEKYMHMYYMYYVHVSLRC